MPYFQSTARALARLCSACSERLRRDPLDVVGVSITGAMAFACLLTLLVEIAPPAAAKATAAATRTASDPAPELATRDGAELPEPGRATTATTSTTTTVPPVPADPGIAAPASYAVPTGKGMWIWQPESADGGNPQAIVDRAEAVGLSHIYVRTGSSRSGFHGQAFLDQILPVAHAAGLQVLGWDFPYLYDANVDIARALAAIQHVTPGGHRIDGFVPDIETPSEGTNLSAENVWAYLAGLRGHVGGGYPLMAAVPRPSESMQGRFPYDAVMPHVSAVAPMVYWLNRQPDSDVAHTLQWFARYGKPILPIGQAYDGAPEGGRPGVPPPDEIERFMGAAEQGGAAAVSFWSWQHADGRVWQTLARSPRFEAIDHQ